MEFGGTDLEVRSVKSGEAVSVEINTVDEGKLLGGVEIPKPIAPSFSKRASTILDLQESGNAIIEAVYDEYREDYDKAFNSIEAAGESIQDDSSLSGGSRLKKVRDASREAAESVAALDTEFFGDVLIPAVKEMAQMVWNAAESSSPPRRARNTLEIMKGALLSQSRDSAKVHLPLPRD